MKANTKVLAVILVLVIALSLPFYPYEWSLFMHVVGTILFLGNIVVSAAWMSLARRSGNPKTVRFAAAAVRITDAYFNVPGLLLLLINGCVLSVAWLDAGQASWLYVSIVLFVLLGVVWAAVLRQAQRQMTRFNAADRRADDGLPDEFFASLKKWYRWGGIATLIPVIILVLMVLKPNLW